MPLRNGTFPAMSVNKGCHSHQQIAATASTMDGGNKS